ncbi:dTDP-glucose 4,6-dehydratase [Caballeronia novacaledonica]|uniref:dTDP-glucose 4,6-dehydratase n=1 Tax=Caballeronia novacaledonica TaxID=1544861 RepID=A0A2U3I420_9BURK|nr:NAD(P)-dependent oxidoreductase [Caballeronia novacaledonica]SPB14851.1 dTDP-glucose 4,6-dehydratase [Caballeronia novacaledonica]
MNILVTGGSGFLGSYVMAALESRGHKALNFDLAPPQPDLLSLSRTESETFRSGQIGDYDRLLEICRNEGIESIVHGAALLGLEPSLHRQKEFYATNVMGFVNVCEIARALGLRKLILVSSNAVYHASSNAKLLETDEPFSIVRGNPAAHYGTSKMAAEAIGMAYAQFHNVDFLAIRVTAVYGFGMRSPIHIKPMVENSLLGKPTRFETGGKMKRDYTYVLDCADAIATAVDAPALPFGSQRVFNVSAGKVCTVSQVAQIVRSVIPGAQIEVGSELTALEEANLKMRAPLYNGCAERHLNWSSKWTIEEGVRDYASRFSHFAQHGHSV